MRRATDKRFSRDALLVSLEGALPRDDERRPHWMVTVACCAQSAATRSCRGPSGIAYHDFRSRLASLVERGVGAAEDDAETLAEQLIAVADGIALQALFDPAGWPADR